MSTSVVLTPPPQMLLHYRVKGVIGAGGMGTVFEAEDTRLGRQVAIKLLNPSDSHDPESRERFLREARAAASIDHPNLCTVHAIEETPSGTLLLVMTLYRGQSLADLLKVGPVAPERILSVGKQVAAGLHEAHMAGIIHRDIKPANLFLLSTGDVKTLDFGLSRLGKQSHLTQPHQVLGTLAYMSPEQLSGGDLDHRTDLWALGAVLYEMAAGHSPFQHSSSANMISLIGKAEYVPLARVWSRSASFTSPGSRWCAPAPAIPETRIRGGSAASSYSVRGNANRCAVAFVGEAWRLRSVGTDFGDPKLVCNEQQPASHNASGAAAREYELRPGERLLQ